MNEFNKKYLGFASHCLCFGMACIGYRTWLLAFFNGYSICFGINDYNEAGIEFVLLPITLLFCIVGLIYSYKNLKK